MANDFFSEIGPVGLRSLLADWSEQPAKPLKFMAERPCATFIRMQIGS